MPTRIVALADAITVKQRDSLVVTSRAG